MNWFQRGKKKMMQQGIRENNKETGKAVSGSRLFLLLLLLLALLVPGCGRKEPDSFLGMEDRELFLFVRKTNGQNEISLFNNQGEQILSLKDYWVVQCIDEGREMGSTSFDIISENTVLVLAAGEGTDYEAGTFSVKEQKWIQEPLPGPVAISQEQGRLHSISIGQKTLDQNFRELPFSDIETMKSRSYLCDLSGEIIQKEWNYEYVNYESVFANPNWDYLKFWSGEESEKRNVHFMNAATGEAVEFPKEAEEYIYAGNGYFLMQEGLRYRIYDAVEKKTGESFDIPEGLMGVNVYGLKSYLVSAVKENIFCLNGSRRQIDKNDMFGGALSYTGGDGNAVLVLPEKAEGLPRSYVFDRSGKVIFTGDAAVLWGERGYYLIEEGGSCTLVDSDKKRS